MDNAIIFNNKMTAICNAIREKTGGTETLGLDAMASEIANISSTSGVELNFDIVGGTTQPENPTENTIWINTDSEITGWAFSFEPYWSIWEDGTVWIKIGLGTAGGFNAITVNSIEVYPSSAKQVFNHAGYNKEMRIYQNGEWKQFGTIPSFTYDGSYKITDDFGNEISKDSNEQFWNLHLLTSGTLTFTDFKDVYPGEMQIFLAGGGGGGGNGILSQNYGSGGGGGYTYSGTPSTTLVEGENYIIAIGAGGLAEAKGGTTIAFGRTVEGGNPGAFFGPGGDGGSGGGGAGGGNGGSDGSDGATNNTVGGKGSGYSTRPFNDPMYMPYAGGGGGGSLYANATGGVLGGGTYVIGTGGTNGTPNTGGGGGGGGAHDNSQQGGMGGSGIVIIRAGRE